MNAADLAVIVLVAGAPWIAGIAFYWRRRSRDSVVQSWGEYLRQRMSVR
jgi:hypothetical protein